MEIEFLRPASIDDMVTVRTVTESISGARIVLRQGIFRGDEQLIAATVTVALVGPKGTAVRLPPDIRRVFGAT
jgi:acyl-CoA thioester hydrolase